MHDGVVAVVGGGLEGVLLGDVRAGVKDKSHFLFVPDDEAY